MLVFTLGGGLLTGVLGVDYCASVSHWEVVCLQGFGGGLLC